MKDKKTLLILIPFLLFVLIVGALAIVGDRIPDNPPETVGNTAGTIPVTSVSTTERCILPMLTTATPYTPWILRNRISKNWAMLP